VLVLHGAPGPLGVAHIVEHLATEAHVLAPTHPGWDDTPRPADFDSVGQIADSYLRLLDARGATDVAVVASSFGGWVALEVALRDAARPVEERRIGRLVILDGIGPRIEGFAAAVPSGPPPGAPASTSASGRGPGAGSMAVLRIYAGPELNDPTLLGRLGAIAAPTLIIWGAKDPVLPPAYGEVVAAAIPGARFEVVEGAGHVPTREQPEVAFALIDGFLRG
jgi:pimeloyl-ACP methyl ester carboxylesterase